MKESDNEQDISGLAAPQVHREKQNRMVFCVSLSRLAQDNFLPSMTAPDTDYDTWRTEMQAVQVELDRVKVLNAPTVALNRAITRSNILNPLIRESLLPMPFHPEKWVGPYLLREEKHSSFLTRKTPVNWKRDVELIADQILRAAVASIVWWDFFGHRPVRQRWPHLDKYLDHVYVPIDKEEMKRGLALAGYSPWHAHRRLSAALDYAPDKIDRAGQPKRHCKVNNIFHNVAKK